MAITIHNTQEYEASAKLAEKYMTEAQNLERQRATLEEMIRDIDNRRCDLYNQALDHNLALMGYFHILNQ